MPARTKLEDCPGLADILVNRWRVTHSKRGAYLAAHIDAATLESYLQRGRQGEEPFAAFSERWEKAEADWIAERCDVIHNAAQGGTWTAAAWDLERHLPDEYGLKTKQEITGPGGGAVQVETNSTLTLLADPEACALATALIGRISGGGEAITDEPERLDEGAEG